MSGMEAVACLLFILISDISDELTRHNHTKKKRRDKKNCFPTSLDFEALRFERSKQYKLNLSILFLKAVLSIINFSQIK